MEKEMATHSSILTWKSPWTEEPGGLQSVGLPDWACVHKGGGRWVGSNAVVEQKKKKEKHMTNIQRHSKEEKECLKKPFCFISVHRNAQDSFQRCLRNNTKEQQRATGFVL